MKSVALEWGRHGLRCNSICPGAVDTPMIDNQPGYDVVSGHPGGTRAELIDGGHHFHVMKNLSLPDPADIADATVLLHSDLSRRITGVAQPVEAGHMLLAGYNHDPVRWPVLDG